MECYNSETGVKLVILKKYAILPEGYQENPVEEDSEKIKEEKLEEIKTNASKALEPYVSLYCQPERDSWTTQLEEAKAYDEDPAASTPFLNGMEAEGVGKAELVAAILKNKAQFDIVLASVLGKRVVKADKIKAICKETLSNQEKIDKMNLVDINI